MTKESYPPGSQRRSPGADTLRNWQKRPTSPIIRQRKAILASSLILARHGRQSPRHLPGPRWRSAPYGPRFADSSPVACAICDLSFFSDNGHLDVIPAPKVISVHPQLQCRVPKVRSASRTSGSVTNVPAFPDRRIYAKVTYRIHT